MFSLKGLEGREARGQQVSYSCEDARDTRGDEAVARASWSTSKSTLTI